MHASGHKPNMNSLGLGLAGFLRTGINHEGLPLGKDGSLSKLEVPKPLPWQPAMLPWKRLAYRHGRIKKFGKICLRAG